MSATTPITFRFNDDEMRIIKRRAEDLGISAAELFREFVWFDGMCPSSHPLTTEMRKEDKVKRDEMTKIIADKLESGETLVRPSFKAVLQEVAREVMLEIKEYKELEQPVAKAMLRKIFPDL